MTIIEQYIFREMEVKPTDINYCEICDRSKDVIYVKFSAKKHLTICKKCFETLNKIVQEK